MPRPRSESSDGAPDEVDDDHIAIVGLGEIDDLLGLAGAAEELLLHFPAAGQDLLFDRDAQGGDQLAELFESYRKRGKGGEHLYDPERCLSFLSVWDRCYAKNTERITVMLPA